MNIDSDNLAISRLVWQGPFCILCWQNKAAWPIVYVSENVKNLAGYEACDLVDGKISFLSLFENDTLTEIDQQVNAAISKAEMNVQLKNCRIKCSDGGYIWVEFHVSIIRDSAGTVEQFVGYIRNVENIVGEIQRLQNSEAELKAIVKALPDDILLIDRQGLLHQYRDLNNRDISILEAGQAVLHPGLDVSEMFPADFSDAVIENVNRCIDESRIIVDEYFYHSASSDEKQYIEARFSPKSAHEAIVVLRDITERKTYEEKLQFQKNIAEAANTSKTKFLASVTHELKTPLNAIGGFAQLLLLENKDDDNSESINEIILASDLLLSLIDDLLDMSRAESGMLSLEIEKVLLQRVINECMRIVSPNAVTRGIDIVLGNHLDEGSNELYVSADAKRLKQVVLNFLSNAIKYNKGQGSVDVSVVVMNGENRIRVEIKDTGIGLTPEQIQQMFIPFSRVSYNQETVSGTGLGLSISKELVEQMGGEVGVDSEIGVGSCFWIELNEWRE